MSEIARQAGIGRVAIYKGLIPGGNATLETLTKATKTLGLRFAAD